jgi:hypothetical protein
MQLQFSVDEGQSFATAETLIVVEEGESRPAGADDFSHIRWVMQNELAVGAMATARFMAVLK